MAPRVYSSYSAQDPSFFNDLDDKKVEVHKPFLKITADGIRAWRADHPNGAIPQTVFNERDAFKLVKDVSSSKKGLRSGGTDDLESAGEFKLCDVSWKRKEAFDYEEAFLPNGPPFIEEYRTSQAGFDDPRNAVPISSYNLSALEAALKHFNGEARRYTDAVSAKTEKEV